MDRGSGNENNEGDDNKDDEEEEEERDGMLGSNSGSRPLQPPNQDGRTVRATSDNNNNGVDGPTTGFVHHYGTHYT